MRIYKTLLVSFSYRLCSFQKILMNLWHLKYWNVYPDQFMPYLKFCLEKKTPLFELYFEQNPFASTASRDGMICQKHSDRLNDMSMCFTVHSKFVGDQFSSFNQAFTPVCIQKLCWCHARSGLIAISVLCSTTCQNRRTPHTQLLRLIFIGHCGKHYLKLNFYNQSSWAGPSPIHSPANFPISFHTLI